MSLKKKLERYRQHLKTEKKEETHTFNERQEEYTTSIETEEYHHITKNLEQAAKKLGATPVYFEDQMILTKESSYSIDSEHGLYPFSQIFDVVSKWNLTRYNHPLSSKDILAEDLLFFDTETTGLGAGAGHMIFLLGCARIIGNEVKVKQYFLPGPGHEVALYHHFLTEVGDLKNLVTFNGKSFDWPRVKTRHTFVRNMVPKLPLFGHYDLLHASRRLWKNTLPATNLGTIENDILQVPRKEDVPGSMAPFLYFQFQKNHDPALVDGIFKHNEEDILTLISLYIHLSRLILNLEKNVTLEEKYQIARWFAYLKNGKKAIELFKEITEEDCGDHATHAKIALVYLYKKEKDYDSVVRLVKELEETHGSNNQLYIELAKIYEHQQKDYKLALEYTKKAYQYLERRKLSGQRLDEEQNTIIKRIERLKNKMEID